LAPYKTRQRCSSGRPRVPISPPGRFADSNRKRTWALAGRRWGGRRQRRSGTQAYLREVCDSLKASWPILPMPGGTRRRAREVGRVLPYPDPKSSACLEHELAQQRQLLAGVGPRAGGEQAAEMAHTPVLVDGVRGRQAHRVAGALTHLRRRARRGKGHGRTSYSWDRATGDRATSPAQRILTWESCICAWPASQGAIRHVRCAETGLMRLLGDYVVAGGQQGACAPAAV